MQPDRLQLLLPFEHAPSYDPRDFLPARSNQEALAWLDTHWPDRRLALWGPEGCGKSHLLHIWAQQAGIPVLASQAIHGLEQIPESGGFALDDADVIAPEPILLHMLNTAWERGLRVLLAGRTPPARWAARLPDLSSRLRSMTAVEIHAPDETLLAALLMRLLADRQLSVAAPVQAWLLTRLPRSPAALRRAVARLDQMSLASGKAITRSLAAQLLTEDGFTVPEMDEVSMAPVDPSSWMPGFL